MGAWAACVPGSAFQAQAAGGWIRGQVVSAVTAEPVRKAVVRLSGVVESSDGRVEEIRETDGEGRFAFDGLGTGRYRVTASRDGFVDSGAGARGEAAVEVALGVGERREGVAVRLTPMAVIEGRVVDEDGDPLMGVRVEVLKPALRGVDVEWVAAGEAMTDDRGEYRVTRLWPGRYLALTQRRLSRVTELAERFGVNGQGPDWVYGATYYPSASRAGDAGVVSAEAGGETRGVDIEVRRQKAFRISGTVVRQAGVGAVLAWEREGSGGRVIDRNLEPRESAFALRGMTPGSYTLYAEPDEDRVTSYAQQAVEVTDRDIEGVSMRLVPVGSVAGSIRVVEAGEGLDPGKLSVSVTTPGISYSADAAVGRDFTFEIRGINASRFAVGLKGLAGGYFVKSIRYGGEEVGRGWCGFSAGAKMEITVSGAAARLGGVVLGEGDKAEAGAVVILARSDGEPAAVAATGEDGAFHIEGLGPGEYMAAASREGAAEAVLDRIWKGAGVERFSLGERESKRVILRADTGR